MNFPPQIVRECQVESQYNYKWKSRVNNGTPGNICLTKVIAIREISHTNRMRKRLEFYPLGSNDVEHVKNRLISIEL